MHSKPGKGKIGGLAVYVGDCYIWAAIAYLDSPTDYRECLPHGEEQPASRSGLVMSASKDRPAWIAFCDPAIVAALASMLLLLATRIWG